MFMGRNKNSQMLVINRKVQYMKKSIAVITGVIVLTVTGLAFAQMPDKGKEMMGDKKEMMEGKGGMMGMMGGKGMMGMMKMCQSMMNKLSLVAVGDGVVVLSGKKLYKYDANLNLVKEADVKVEEMDMMGKDKMGADEKESPEEAAEHASHHPEK
jgi:hypothetical protein